MGIYLVTGANRGIGLELTGLLAGRGDVVVAVCRRSSKSLERLGDRVHIEARIDVTSDADIGRLRIHLREVRFDGLILNAGVLVPDNLAAMSYRAILKQFEVNALGPLRVTRALLKNLRPRGKIAILSSRMGSIAETTGGDYGYRMSKAAVNMAGACLAHDLAAQGIAVALLHPGFVRTEMTNNQGVTEPRIAAHQLLERIDDLTLDGSGQLLHAHGETLRW